MKFPELDLDEKFSFQQKLWEFERAGWWASGALILLALFGLFGSGPLSTVRLTSPTMKVQVDRFARSNSEDEIKVVLNGHDTFWISSSVFDYAQIESMVPAPETSLSVGSLNGFKFKSTKLSHENVIRVFLKYHTPGVVKTSFFSGEDPQKLEEPLELTRIIYP